MPRPKRQLSAGVYHVMSRGVAGQSLFLDPIDCIRFVSLLERGADRLGWICHAYCLLTDDYQLVVETPDANLSRGMHGLNGAYAQSFNERHDRRGHVFGSRFSSVLIEPQDRLMEACRRVLRGPVRAGLCGSPEEWPWSGGAAIHPGGGPWRPSSIAQ